MIKNVQVSVDRLFDSPEYLKAKNYNESLWYIYNMINSSYTDYHWIMTVKIFDPNLTDTSELYYFNCDTCFTQVDLKKNLEYMVAGVPANATPNTNYLYKRAFFTEMNRYDNAKEIANKVFNGFCLSGIQVISMFEDLANIYPSEWNGVSERTNDPGTFTMRFWSIKEDCPVNSQ
jgi:hypothetical protein